MIDALHKIIKFPSVTCILAFVPAQFYQFLLQKAEFSGLLQSALSIGAADVALCNAVCTTCEEGQEWAQAVEVLRKLLDSDPCPRGGYETMNYHK